MWCQLKAKSCTWTHCVSLQNCVRWSYRIFPSPLSSNASWYPRNGTWTCTSTKKKKTPSFPKRLVAQTALDNQFELRLIKHQTERRTCYRTYGRGSGGKTWLRGMRVLLSGGSCLGVDVFSLGWTTQSHTHNHNSEASPQTVYVHVVITQKEHTPIFSIVYSKPSRI